MDDGYVLMDCWYMLRLKINGVKRLFMWGGKYCIVGNIMKL